MRSYYPLTWPMGRCPDLKSRIRDVVIDAVFFRVVASTRFFWPVWVTMKSKHRGRLLIGALIAQVVVVQFALDAHYYLHFPSLFRSQHTAFSSTTSATSPTPHSDCGLCRTGQTYHSLAAVQTFLKIRIPEVLTPQEPEAEGPSALFVFSHTTRGPPPLNL